MATPSLANLDSDDDLEIVFAGYTSLFFKVFFGNDVGIKLIISLIFLGSRKLKGFPISTNILANLKYFVFGKTTDKKLLSIRSKKGLS